MTSENKKCDSLSSSDYVGIYRLYRDYVMAESGLIGARLTWILTIDGFLFTTFGFCLQKKIEVIRAHTDTLLTLKDTVNWSSDLKATLPIYDATLQELGYFMALLAVIGILVSGLGWVAIRTAQIASEETLKLFENSSGLPHVKKDTGIASHFISDGIAFPHIRGGGNKISIHVSQITSQLIPVLLSITWIIILMMTIHWL